MDNQPKNLAAENSPDIFDHFPFSKIRATQTQALTVAAEWLAGPKKFMIFEGPTGVGKSGIGMAVASYAKTLPAEGYTPGAYVLSPQISLTGQYMNDFAKNGLVELKGQSNYFCSEFDMDCEAASMVFDDAHNRHTCTGYKPAKEYFLNNPLGTCNFTYYIAETTTAHQLEDRTVLVLDEGHNCEEQILKFCVTEITQKKCDEYEVPEKLPLFNEGDLPAVRDWLTNVLVPSVQIKYREYERLKARAKEQGKNEESAKFARLILRADKFLQTIAMFVNADEPGEWFAWSDWDAEKKKGTGDLIIKPLSARYFADDILFSKARKVLIMSATILDFGTFMRNLGIDPKDAVVLAVDSEFPLEHRPLFYKPCGNMRRHDIQTTLPKMAQEIEKLMVKYAKHKGIVHTQSYTNTNYFVNYLQMQGFTDRILTHSSGQKGSRDAVIDTHHTATNPTVIFSPSMTEGLDLKEDLGRWGVITKVPYPAIDPYVKARMQKDPDWYDWLTALKLVQATGRIVRSMTDTGVMWILDSGFSDFLRRAKNKMPRYWRDSIVDLSKFS